MSTELVVALDYNDQNKADELIDKLSGLPVIYKIGLELFISADSNWIQSICSSGVRVFLDLKFHDIPNTVAASVIKVARLGAEFTTIHLSGGARMLDEIDVKLNEAMVSGDIVAKPKILGVSVLTSFEEEDWIANMSHMAKLSGIRTIADSVMHFSTLANEHSAVHGIVCSPHEIEMIRLKYPELFLMIPGIRLKGGSEHDQKRVMTPADASKAGASAIVVGRSISLADDPRKTAELILGEIL